MDTKQLQEPQFKTVAKLTKQQFTKAAEIRHSKDAAFLAMQDLVRTAYTLYEDRKAVLMEQEQEFWQTLYADFELDPVAVYSIDNKEHTLIQHIMPSPEVQTEAEALTVTEADFVN